MEPSLLRKSIDWLQARTVGEDKIPMGNAYGDPDLMRGEYTKPDKFLEPYIGKQYESSKEQYAPFDGLSGTEVLSVGLEKIYLDAGALAAEDPDMFDFVWNAIRGREHWSDSGKAAKGVSRLIKAETDDLVPAPMYGSATGGGSRYDAAEYAEMKDEIDSVGREMRALFGDSLVRLGFDTLNPNFYSGEEHWTQALETLSDPKRFQRWLKKTAKHEGDASFYDQWTDLVRRRLQDSALLGANIARNQLEHVGLDLSPAQLEAVYAEVSRITDAQVSQLADEILKEFVEKNKERWGGKTADGLDKQQETQFLLGQVDPWADRRSDLMKKAASDLVVDPMNRGALEYYKRVPAVKQIEWKTSPSGDQPCKICGPLNDKRAEVGQPFVGRITRPPAHEGCRCWVIPLVEKKAAKQPSIAPNKPQTAAEARAALRKLAGGLELYRMKKEKELKKKLKELARQIQEVREEAGALEGLQDRSAGQTEQLFDRLRMIDELSNQKAGVLQELRSLEDKTMWDAAMDILSVDEPVEIEPDWRDAERPRVFSTGRVVEFADSISQRTKETFAQGAKAFGRLVDRRILPFTFSTEVNVSEFKDRWGRAFYDHSGVGVALSQEDEPWVVVHELGHWLDEAPNILKKSTAFLARRTVDDPAPVKLNALTSNRSYEDHEITRPDKFMHPYIGKQYANKDGYSDATEIMSMGLQLMYQDPWKFAQEDPDMFDFIWNTVRGR